MQGNICLHIKAFLSFNLPLTNVHFYLTRLNG